MVGERVEMRRDMMESVEHETDGCMADRISGVIGCICLVLAQRVW